MSWHHPDFLRLGITKEKYKELIAEEPNEEDELKKCEQKEEVNYGR